MSSSVFYRFKSQKEPSRVSFDGTGISVFELKKEIIAESKLGDGTDFELTVSSEDSNEGTSIFFGYLLYITDFFQSMMMIPRSFLDLQL